jgi:ABC-type lipoprotein release transport system permease subunit
VSPVKRSVARSAVRLWSGREVRRRWLSLVVLGVLAGLAAGLVTAAVGGAQRSATAYPRMREQLLAADAVFFPSQVSIGDADVTKLSSIPEVAAWSGFALLPGWFDQLGPNSGPLLPVGDSWFTTIERPKILQGRLPDPKGDDEAVVNEAALKYGAHVGMTLTFRTYTPADYSKFGDTVVPKPDQLHGPVTNMKVVGVVRLPLESVLPLGAGPNIYPSPGWFAKHHGQVAIYFTNAFVRLKQGAADVATFQARVAQVYGRSDIPIKDLSDDIKRVEDSTDLERTALLLFALAALIASFVLIGQAFVRSVHAESDSVPTLNAMGLDPPALVTGLTLPHLLSVGVAAVVTTVTTVALWARFPIGLARQLDPDVGYHAPVSYLLIGAAAAAFVTLAVAFGAAWLTTRAVLGHSRTRRTRVVGAMTRSGAPVPAAVGASLALEQSGSKGSVPVRPALAAATAAVLGVVGAVTLVTGIDDAVHDPARTGRTWQLEAEPNTMDQVDASARLPGVSAAALGSRAATTVRGQDVPFYAIEHLKGAINFVVLHGRAPEGNDEIMLGAHSAKVLHAKIGSTLRADSGGPELHVVGIGLLVQTPHTTFDEGGLVTMSTLDAASRSTIGDREGFLLVDAPKEEVARVQAGLQRLGVDAAPPDPVPDVLNLAQVRRLPYLLAGFLILLGLGAVGHALMTVSRRRSKELAVLRAVGLSPGQAAACVAWQAIVVALIALGIGIPLGVIVGREVWQAVANSVPLVYVGPFSPRLLIATVPIALAALLIMSVAPAWQAARLQTAETLRTE